MRKGVWGSVGAGEPTGSSRIVQAAQGGYVKGASAKRLAVFATTVTVTVAGLGSGAWAAPDQPAAPGPVSTINWGACDDPGLQEAGGECGYLSVPLDYNRPNGTKIQLAVSRIKHKTPDSKYQGIMLTNPGGPGGSGLTLSTLGQY